MATIRPIRIEDESALASVIRKVMSEFDADPQTTILGDPVLDKMYHAYLVPRSSYYIAETEGKILGGAGVKQLDGASSEICELQRMFLLPEARGKGLGQQLMDICIADARKFGYTRIYLETLGDMKEAQKLYLRSGFQKIDKPLGNTGHSGCNLVMLREL